MTDAADSPAADTSTAPDWARAILARQIDILSELAESGLRLALAIETDAIEAEPAHATDCALAHARVAKTVRLTLMLQTEQIKYLRQFDKTLTFDARDRARQRKDTLANIVERIADREGQDAEHLGAEARDRLDQEDLYGDVLARPASELIAEICRDLGLSPDWPKLAEEVWARDEMASNAPGQPLASLKPPADPGGGRNPGHKARSPRIIQPEPGRMGPQP